MIKSNIIQSVTLAGLIILTPNANADNFTVEGTIDAKISVNNTKQGALIKSRSLKDTERKIKLLKVKVSTQMQTSIHKRLLEANQYQFSNRNTPIHTKNLPEKMDLGMNGVPVLDQGWHGSCVTFANVGAIDAALGHEAKVSPLCSLELGKTLAKNGFFPSGWHGSKGPIVLEQFSRFGYIDMDVQQSQGCGGLTQYPTKSDDEGEPMELGEFYDHSRPLRSVGWAPIQATLQADDSTPIDHHHVVEQIKHAINDRHRVTFALLIDTKVESTYPGATGTLESEGDTWVLSETIKNHLLSNLNYYFNGHEMIITGYDDNAEVTDEDGKKHKGVFILRNSWGDTGNHGTFYMTYEYAQYLLLEAQRIVGNKDKLDS